MLLLLLSIIMIIIILVLPMTRPDFRPHGRRGAPRRRQEDATRSFSIAALFINSLIQCSAIAALRK